MAAAWNMLAAVKVSQFLQTLQDVRELPADLMFLQRTAVVPATEGEINARFLSRVQIADLIADNSRARVYKFGKFQFESGSIPNIKIGVGLDQEELNQLEAIKNNTALAANQVFPNFIQDHLDALLLGIRQRWEALIIAMWLDTLSYNRMGIIMSGVRFGCPNDLKITTSPAWTDATNGTPVSDILTQKLYAKQRYGERYNRMTMSLQGFRYMIATTEFQNKARTFLAPNVSYVNIPVQNIDYMKNLAQSVMEISVIEFYDSRFWSQSTSGVTTSALFFPINQVVLSDTTDDNRQQVSDLGNAIVTESIVAGLVKTNMVGGLTGPTRGPVGYFTAADAHLNPPGIVGWGVARSMPRRKRLTFTSILTIGSFSDTIPVGEPFTGIGY